MCTALRGFPLKVVGGGCCCCGFAMVAMASQHRCAESYQVIERVPHAVTPRLPIIVWCLIYIREGS